MDPISRNLMRAAASAKKPEYNVHYAINTPSGVSWIRVYSLDPDGNIIRDIQVNLPSAVRTLKVTQQGHIFLSQTGRVSRIAANASVASTWWTDTTTGPIDVSSDGVSVYRAIGPNENAQVFKFNPSFQWANTFSAVAESVAVDANDFVYGGTRNNLLRKINQSGSTVWTSSAATDRVYAIGIDSAGFPIAYDRNRNLRKHNPSNGSVLWAKNFLMLSAGTIDTISVKTDKFDNIYIGGGNNSAIIKLDNDGNIMQTVSLGFSAVDIAVDPEGFMYAVENSGDVYKYDPEGGLVWSHSPPNGYIPRKIAVDPGEYGAGHR